MSKVDKGEYEFANTLKPADLEKGKKVETKITEMKQVKTKYGDKRIAVLESGQQIFLNAMTLQNLVEAFGDEDDNWVGKEITLEVETSERTKGKDGKQNSAIVVTPTTKK